MSEARHSWALRILRWLPLPLAQAPERVVLNSACIIIGAAALVPPRPGSLFTTWPEWAPPVWGIAMLVGGVATLAGMWRCKISLERLGYLLVGGSCLLFGVSALVVFGPRAIPTGLIFFSFALAKAIRMLVSSAARDTVLEVGEQMDRDERDGT